MAASDDLRSLARGCAEGGCAHAPGLLALADRIDGEIDAVCREDPEITDRWVDAHRAELEAHGLVRGPVGADGRLVLAGDYVEDAGYGAALSGRVRRVELAPHGWRVSVEGVPHPQPPYAYRHRPPTLEEILREFGDEYIRVVESPNPKVGFGNEIVGEEEPDDVIREYARRLRLREGNEG